MDEENTQNHEELEEQAPEPVAPPPAKAEGEAQPEIFTMPPPSGKEPWRSGGGCGRAPAYGCVIGIVLLIAALFGGVSLLRKSVWMSMERGRQQVVQGLPFQLAPGERLRTTRNLERFRTVLETSADPYPLIGEFGKRVRAAFEDGRLTVEEIEELNLFIEKVIEESGIPGMQLGIRNSEFGIRNDGPSPRLLRVFPVSKQCSRNALTERMTGTSAGRAQARPNSPQYPRLPPRADNSEFRIPNSEFS